jgi:hypothetical protein
MNDKRFNVERLTEGGRTCELELLQRPFVGMR